jgi:hypothetical protein
MPPFHCRCVGASFRGKDTKDYVSRIVHTGDEVELFRDRTNQHDANAIRVLHLSHWIGYIDRDSAAEIAPLLDRDEPYEATVVGWSSPILPHLEVKFSEAV